MKKILGALLLSAVMLLTVSCDLFMDYEKPSLYIVTVGIQYNYLLERHDPKLTNTQADADTIKELFTGLADQAHMDWYSVTYRDSYPKKGYCSEGTAEIELTSSKHDGPKRNERKSLTHLAYSMSPDITIMNVISDMLYNTRGMKAPTKNDIIVFYYAGHGMPDEGIKGDLWFIPSIWPYKSNIAEKSLISLEKELFSPSSFITRFPGHKVVLLDSCFSGNVIPNDRDTINGGLGGNNSLPNNNPYYDPDFIQEHIGYGPNKDRREPMIEGGGSKPHVPENDDDVITAPRNPANSLVPEIYIITSANSNQEAADGKGLNNSPFVYGIIEELQPGWQLGDPVVKNRKRILLSDIFKAAKKFVVENITNQDPQTLLTRYDLVLFDFTR